MAYRAAQLSYLVSLGMRHDAPDDAAESFARGLSDIEFAEFERIGIEEADDVPANPPTDPITRSQTPPVNPPVNPPADPITRSQTPPSDNPADVDERIQRALADAQRVRQERHEFIRTNASDDVPRDLVERAYREEWDQTRVASEFLRAVRTRPAPVAGGQGPAIHSHSHDAHCTLEALQGGLLLRHGFSLDSDMFARDEASAMLRREDCRAGWLNNLAANRSIARADSAQLEQFERARDAAHRYSRMSMVDFAREALRLSNRPIPVDVDDMIHRALSTATLSSIFSTSVNMQILAAYLGIEDSTRGWVFEADVANFKKNERGRLTKASGMKKLARGHEAESIEYSDEVEEYKIARYAGQFSIDEQDFIDDSFGALSEHTPTELGELAAELRPNLVYAIMLANRPMRDGQPLFHSTHGNLETSSALSSGTLRVAKQNMATQTENGRSIKNAMRYLIVPEALQFTADQLVTSAEQRGTAGAAENGTANPHKGKFTVVSDPRLDNGVTDPDTGDSYDGSETAWYGAAQAGRTGIEVGYRRGTGRAPRMETFVHTGARWGMGWKCNMDIGAKAIDWRGLHKSTG